MTERFLLSIATYRRPDGLRRLLDSLLTAIDDSATVVVTDNDPETSARGVVERHPLATTYVVEAEPGIASARNRGLDFFTDDFDAIVFLDDDEWVDPGWYTALREYFRDSGADVVQGPVITVLPPNAPSWVLRGGFYQRKARRTGDALLSAATNNTALRRSAWLNSGSPRFDPAFSSTGGSDWDLFWGLRRNGATIRFCAEAVVSEDVPADRLTFNWIKRRLTRNGIVEARVAQKHGEPLAPFLAKALAIGVVGAAQLVAGLLTGRGLQSRALSRTLISYGKIRGLLGFRVHEYARADSGKSPSRNGK